MQRLGGVLVPGNMRKRVSLTSPMNAKELSVKDNEKNVGMSGDVCV